MIVATTVQGGAWLLRLAATLWAGVMSGFFWSFSTVVMPGLAAASPPSALQAMQAINAAVHNSLFAAGFFGMPLICILVVGHAIRIRDRGATLALIGAVCYLTGTFLVTVLGNVPMNRELALLDPLLPESAAAMSSYILDWTMLNDLRTVAALAAFILLTVSLSLTKLQINPKPVALHGPPAQ
jgi:uncharacterized membrane protein